jgi:hypothetical protein
VECIFADKPDSFGPTHLNHKEINLEEKPARWVMPEGRSIVGSPACIDGGTVWVLSGKLADPNLALLHFEHGESKPVSFSFQLEKTKDSGLSSAHPLPPYKWVQIEAAPKSVAIGGDGIRGLWIVSVSEFKHGK